MGGDKYTPPPPTGPLAQLGHGPARPAHASGLLRPPHHRTLTRNPTDTSHIPPRPPLSLVPSLRRHPLTHRRGAPCSIPSTRHPVAGAHSDAVLIASSPSRSGSPNAAPDLPFAARRPPPPRVAGRLAAHPSSPRRVLLVGQRLLTLRPSLVDRADAASPPGCNRPRPPPQRRPDANAVRRRCHLTPPSRTPCIGPSLQRG